MSSCLSRAQFISDSSILGGGHDGNPAVFSNQGSGWVLLTSGVLILARVAADTLKLGRGITSERAGHTVFTT